jgi:hypothetical protein
VLKSIVKTEVFYSKASNDRMKYSQVEYHNRWEETKTNEAEQRGCAAATQNILFCSLNSGTH